MTYIIRWSETTQNECCCLVPAGCLSTDFTTWSILNKAVWGAWNKSLLSPPNSQLSASSQLNWGTSANSVVALMRVHTRDSRQFRLIWCSWIRATNRREKNKKKKEGITVMFECPCVMRWPPHHIVEAALGNVLNFILGQLHQTF